MAKQTNLNLTIGAQRDAAIAALPEIAPLAESMLTTVRGLDVVDAESCAHMADARKALQEAEKKLKAKKKSVTDPLTSTTRAINALFKPAEDALEEALSITKHKLDGYAHRQMVIASEQQAADLKEARARATATELQVQQLREQGASSTAELLSAQAAAEVAAVTGPAHVEAVRSDSGAMMVTKKKWVGRVVSLKAFAAGVAAGRIPEECLAVNLKALNDHAGKLGAVVIAADPAALNKLYTEDGFSIALVGESLTR